MDELPLSSLERLTEQIQKSLDQVLQTRVIIASNTIEMYTLFEQINAILKQAEKYDSHFVTILNEIPGNEPISSVMETLVLLDREMNELSKELDEFV